MDIVEPEQIVAVVVMRRAVQAREQEGMGILRRTGNKDVTDRHDLRCVEQLLEETGIGERHRIGRFPMEIAVAAQTRAIVPCEDPLMRDQPAAHRQGRLVAGALEDPSCLGDVVGGNEQVGILPG